MNANPTLGLATLVGQLTGLAPPWRATHCTVDRGAKVIHLWVTARPPSKTASQRSWFGLGSAPQPVQPLVAEGPELSWRHTQCLEFSCQVHTLDALDPSAMDLPWFGQLHLPFSNRLSHQVFTCLMEGMDLGAICSMLNLSFADVWKFKHALDLGQVHIANQHPRKVRRSTPGDSASVAAQAVQAAPSEPSPAAVKVADGVPEVSDPLWEGLVTGRVDIQIKTLSFQLILSKLRQQVSVQQQDEVKLLKLRELHRYVQRNARSLQFELNQLRDLAALEPV